MDDNKNTNIATIDDKVRYLQETFENLTPSERGKALIPGDAKYVKGFGPEGRVDYLWPDNLGLKRRSPERSQRPQRQGNKSWNNRLVLRRVFGVSRNT